MKNGMRKGAQIDSILKEGKTAITINNLYSQYSVNTGLYYQSCSKCKNISASKLQRLKKLEYENKRLKQMYATLSIDYEILMELLEKNMK